MTEKHFLIKSLEKAKQLHENGWKLWAQGEPLQNISEWIKKQSNNLYLTPVKVKKISGFMRETGEALDKVFGQKIVGKRILKELQNIDDEILRNLSDLKFLTYKPKLIYEFSEKDNLNPGQSFPCSDGWGEIKMFTTSSGRLNLLSSKPNSEKHLINKWLILFHEASHNEFYTTNEIFNPSNRDYFTDNDIKLINEWGMSRLFYSKTSQMLSEAFADCYGSIMLLETSNHNINVINEIYNLMNLRESTNKDHGFEIYKLCAKTLEILLENRSYWKGKDPEELKKIARQYSSDALIEVGILDNDDNHNVFLNLIEKKMRVYPFLFEYCIEVMNETDENFMILMDKKFSETKMWPHLKKLCHEFKNDLKREDNDIIRIIKEINDNHKALKSTYPFIADFTRKIFTQMRDEDPSFREVIIEYNSIRDYFYNYKLNKDIENKDIKTIEQKNNNKVKF